MVKNVGVEWFNSDDRAAQINAGSYQRISAEIRSAAGQQFQEFIDSHIERRRSFAFENALRTDSGFEQIRRAKELGFRVLMDYIAAGSVAEHIRRVINRAALGGHSASERKLRDIYEQSMRHLITAFEENRRQHIDLLRVFDNSENFGRPRLVLSMVGGVPRNMAPEVPAWLETTLKHSSFSIGTLRSAMRNRGLGRRGPLC